MSLVGLNADDFPPAMNWYLRSLSVCRSDKAFTPHPTFAQDA
ncbi:hypothetical protein ACLK14_00590 [Escherichia coli]